MADVTPKGAPDPVLVDFAGQAISLGRLKFFFIFCPNNSGTTVLSQYLHSQIGGYLPPFGNNEGQMAPAVKAMMRVAPWKRDPAFDWRFIRAEWDKLARGRPFIEASPPNLIRTAEIAEVFGSDSTGLISICNPYQQIASSMRRYSAKPGKTARLWLRKARAVRQARERFPFFPFISYEDFVTDPRLVNRQLNLPVQSYEIAGKKGSDISDIKSGYCRGVAFLQPDEVTRIAKVLGEDPDVMSYFGYALQGPELLEEAQARDAVEFAKGVANRAGWTPRVPAEDGKQQRRKAGGGPR